MYWHVLTVLYQMPVVQGGTRWYKVVQGCMRNKKEKPEKQELKEVQEGTRRYKEPEVQELINIMMYVLVLAGKY
jgi:hypothetical protein